MPEEVADGTRIDEAARSLLPARRGAPRVRAGRMLCVGLLLGYNPRPAGRRVASERALNNAGQVAGTWIQDHDPLTTNSPYLYNPSAGGQVTLVGVTSPSGQSPGGYSFQGNFSGINNNGQAAGWTNDVNPSNTVIYNITTGQITTAPVSSGIITDSGQVYGSIAGGGGNSHPAVYQNGSVQDLGLPPGATSAWVSAANNSGQVVVQAFMQPGAPSQSFELRGGKWTALGTITGTMINNQGAIAGSTPPGTNDYGTGVLILPGGTRMTLALSRVTRRACLLG